MRRAALVIFISLFISRFVWADLVSFERFFSQNSQYGSVQSKESENFKVTWVNERDAIIADALLAHMEAAHNELSSTFAVAMKSKKKVPIEVFPDLQSFSKVSRLSLSRFRATGTIALTLEQRLMILSPRNLVKGYSWAETAVHEYIHYLIREISPQLIPIWLHEGAAQVYQSYPYETEPQLKPSQWGLFKKRRKANKLLDLETLREPFPYRETPEEAELAYIQALIFVRWLDQQCGVIPLLQSIETRKSVSRGLEECTGKSLAVLESEFVPKIMGQVEVPEGSDVEFYARSFEGGDLIESEGRKADQDAQNYAQLSTELFGQGRYRASAMEMEKALSKSVVSPPSWRRHLAISYSKSGKTDESKKVLKSVVEDYPEDAGAWYLIGEKHLSQKRWSDAWQAFLRSFFTNPFLDGLDERMAQLQEKKPELKDQFLLKEIN